MARVTVKLREMGGWKALGDGARRVFTRSGAAADPELGLWWTLDGDVAELARRKEVAEAYVDEPPKPPPPPLGAPPTASDLAAHERDARGQGVSIAALVRAPELFELAPEAAIEIVAPYASVADAIDHAAAELAAGDVIWMPAGFFRSPSATAAAAHATRRWIYVVDGDAATAARAACLQSYAAGIGLGRLSPEEIPPFPGFPDDLPRALDELDARLARRTAPPPRVAVVLEQAKILKGGDFGAAEIYFEGWVDDGAGGRRAFRIPHEGHIPSVRDGQVIPLSTVVYDGRRTAGDALVVHVEAWDEDLGKGHLLDADDLLGTIDRRHGPQDGWGAGRHVDVNAGNWLLTYSIRAS